MNSKSLLCERMHRIKKAVALEKPDRVPVVMEYGAFAAHVTNTPLPEFLLNLKRSVEVMIEAYRLVADVAEADAVNYGRFSPYNLCYAWLSKVKVPGVDLPEEISYQVIEEELMTRKDYDRILALGWHRFFSSYMKERVLKDVPPEYLPANQGPVDVCKDWAKIGVPVLVTNTVASPFEFLCGGRSLTGFSIDLIEIPDKIETVMNEILPHISRTTCKIAKKEGYPAVWVGGWRTAPAMISPQMWNRFVWPYFKRLVYEVLEYGLIPIAAANLLLPRVGVANVCVFVCGWVDMTNPPIYLSCSPQLISLCLGQRQCRLLAFDLDLHFLGTFLSRVESAWVYASLFPPAWIFPASARPF